jgi:hypothetical protein
MSGSDGSPMCLFLGGWYEESDAPHAQNALVRADAGRRVRVRGRPGAIDAQL